jgi:hypothetical protein
MEHKKAELDRFNDPRVAKYIHFLTDEEASQLRAKYIRTGIIKPTNQVFHSGERPPMTGQILANYKASLIKCGLLKPRSSQFANNRKYN